MPPKASNNNGGNRSLPKFGEWDVNNPQSAESFTVIFNTARDQKKNDKGGNAPARVPGPNPRSSPNNQAQSYQYQKHNHQQHSRKKWLCCIFD